MDANSQQNSQQFADLADAVEALAALEDFECSLLIRGDFANLTDEKLIKCGKDLDACRDKIESQRRVIVELISKQKESSHV